MLFQDAKDQVCKILGQKIKLNNKHFYLSLLDKMEREQKFSRLDMVNIWNQTTDLAELSEIQLCVLYKEFEKQYSLTKKLDYFFTQAEIEMSDEKIIKSTDETYPLKFEKVIKYNDNHFVIPLDVERIAKLQNSKILKINPETQRETYSVERNGYRCQYVKTYENQIDEMEDCFLNNNYYPDEIKLNLQKNDDVKFSYNEEMQELIIYSGDIFKIDGNHRILSIASAIAKDPMIKYTFPVSLFVVTEKQAQQIINQQEKKRPINKRVVDSYGNTPENIIVDKIIDADDLSEVLKNRIVREQDNLIRTSSIFIFDTLAKAISLVYDKDDLGRFKNKTTDWLVQFLNDLSYIMEDKFKQTFTTKRKTWALDDVAVYFYINLSKQLQGDNNWQEKLEQILNSVDFTKSETPLGRLDQRENQAAKKLIEGLVI